MGITSHSIRLIQKAMSIKDIKTVIELGAQNLYDQPYTNGIPYADVWYTKRKIGYQCIDLSGENNALKIDLEKPHYPTETYDLVTDFGTSEHIRNPYNVHSTIFKLCKVGRIIIQENPKTENWPGHGFNYKTQEFYKELEKKSGLKIIEIGEEPAMGNTTDGWNVWVIMEKINNNFPKEKDFPKTCSK